MAKSERPINESIVCGDGMRCALCGEERVPCEGIVCLPVKRCPATGRECIKACDGNPPYCAKPFPSSPPQSHEGEKR